MFITFEGGEGSGKSTQCKLLAEYFTAQGKEVVLTREPGGSPIAEEIRKILVTGSKEKLIPDVELLLHITARKDHLEQVMKPALKAGKIVISDRFCDSTLAYQGAGHGLNIEYINNLHNLIIGNLQPDLTFILDIAVDKGLKRAASRHGDENRYEQMDKSFHERIRQCFNQMAVANPKRYQVIDATKTVDEVSAQIKSLLNSN